MNKSKTLLREDELAMLTLNSQPINQLRKAHNNFIAIKLKDHREYRGYLDAQDQHMNLVLRNATEFYNGEKVAAYGKIFIRGNNILWIQIDVTAEK